MDSGASSSIVLGIHKQKLCYKNTQPVKWSTQGGGFLTTHKTNVELVLPELDATKSMTWNFHMDDSQKNSRYDMIMGRDLLLELKLDLCFSYCTIKGNVGAYKACTVYMKHPSYLRDAKIFINERLWESKHVINSTRRTRKILDAKYQKSDLRKIVSNSKHLNNNEQSMLREILTKYESPFEGTLVAWKTKPVYI